MHSILAPRRCSTNTVVTCSAPGGYLDMFEKLRPSAVTPSTQAAITESQGLRVPCVYGTFHLGLENVQDSSRPFKACFWGQGMHWLSLNKVGLTNTSLWFA